MTRKLLKEQIWLMTGSLVVLAIVATGFLLTYTRAVMIPFVLAVFITSIVAPLVDIQVLKLRIPRSFAVALTLLVVVSAFAVITLLGVQAALNIVKSAQDYSEDIASFGHDVLSKIEEWSRVQEWKLQISVDDITRQVQSTVLHVATSTLGNMAGWLSQVLLVLIFVGFLLAARNPDFVRQGIYADIDTQIRRYLGTKVVISAATGILVWITLATFGLELASVFGLLAFRAQFIPSVGSIIATVLPLPTAVAQFHDDWGMLLAAIAIPGAIQMTIGNVIEPKLMGEGLKLHPVTILMSLAIWGLLWGPVGMLFGRPHDRDVANRTRTIRDYADDQSLAGRTFARIPHRPAPGLNAGCGVFCPDLPTAPNPLRP